MTYENVSVCNNEVISTTFKKISLFYAENKSSKILLKIRFFYWILSVTPPDLHVFTSDLRVKQRYLIIITIEFNKTLLFIVVRQSFQEMETFCAFRRLNMSSARRKIKLNLKNNMLTLSFDQDMACSYFRTCGTPPLTV